MRHLPPSLWLLTLLSASIELKAETSTCIVPDVTLDVNLVTNENGTSHVNFTWQFSATYENETICPQLLSVRMFSRIVPFDFEDATEPRGSQYTDLRYTMLNGSLDYHIFTDIDTSLYYQFELRVQANPDSTGFRSNKHFSFIHYFSEQRAARVIDPAQPHTVIRATKGQQVVFPCNGSGIPIPYARLLRDPHDDPVFCSPYVECIWNVILSVRESDAGEYFCVAINTLVNPPLGMRMVRDWKTIQLIVETATTSTPGVSTLNGSTVEGTTAPATFTHVMLDPEVSTGVGESSSYVLLMATVLPPFVLLVLTGILLILIVAMYAHRVLLVNKRALRQDAYYNNCEVGPPSLPTRTVKNTNNMPCKDDNTKPLYWTIADVKDGVKSKANGLDLTIEKNNTHVAKSPSTFTGQVDLAACLHTGGI